MSKPTEAHSGKLGKEKAIPISEINAGGGIEPVSENDFAKKADQESFANDILTIIVAQDNSKDALPVIVPAVNGVNQPIIRGQKLGVKRKFVEALARCTTTTYEQATPDPRKPQNIQMIERTALTYPFTVYNDPHPNGREWLQAILKAS